MKQSIASDTVKLTTSKMITMAISMISVMLLSRFWSLEEYGTYSQLLLVVNLFTTVFMLGLPNSINFFLARTEDQLEKQKFLSLYYTLSTILSFFTGLVLVLSTSIIVEYFNNPIIRDFIYILAIFPWAKIILSSIENVFIVYRRTTHLILFRILNSFSLLIIIMIVELFDLGFATYMALFIFVEAIFTLSVYLIVRKISGNIWFNIDKSLMKKLLNFSIPIGLASVIGVLSVELDKLLIGNFYSTEELAIYTNAAREMPVTIVASSLTAVLMPRLARLLKESRKVEAVNLWGDSIFLSYAIICFFSIGLFVFAPEVISLLYSDKYLPGVEVFRIYNLVLLLRFTYFGIILNSIGKTKFIFYSSLASLGLNLILNYMFYDFFGFIGPAIATFVSLVLVAYFQVLATFKIINVSVSEILPWGSIGYISLINIVFGFVFAFLKILISLEPIIGQIYESIILVIIWGTLYYMLIRKKLKVKFNSLNGTSY